LVECDAHVGGKIMLQRTIANGIVTPAQIAEHRVVAYLYQGGAGKLVTGSRSVALCLKIYLVGRRLWVTEMLLI
jgi:hypothetical protein